MHLVLDEADDPGKTDAGTRDDGVHGRHEHGLGGRAAGERRAERRPAGHGLARSFAGAVVAVLAATIVGVPPVLAQPTSAFYFEGEFDDIWARGNAGYLATPSATFTLDETQVDITDGVDTWVIWVAGPGGVKLQDATTYNDPRGPGHPSAPWFDTVWSGYNLACSAPTGSFTVHDVEYTGDVLQALSLTADLDCPDPVGSFHAELRIGTATPDFQGLARAPFTRSHVTFDHTPVGSMSPTETFTFKNVGDSSLTIGTAGFTGANAADFEVVSDGCSDGSLAVGATCSLGIRFAPVTDGELEAVMRLPVDTALGAHEIGVEGLGQIATTTTITAESDWAVDPAIHASVEPYPDLGPGFIPAIWFEFPGYVPQPGFPSPGGPQPLDPVDGATPSTQLKPGQHQVYAVYNRDDGPSPYGMSQSETITVKVLRTTRIYLRVDENPSVASEPPSISAELEANDGASFSAGTLKIEDVTKGDVLGTLDLAPGQNVLAVQPNLTGGDHLIRATFSGSVGVQGTTEEYTHTVLQDVAMDAKPNTFYPFEDDFRDLLTIEGRRPAGTEVAIEIRDVPGGTVVHEDAVPTGSGPFARTWDGTATVAPSAGDLLPAGEYDVIVTFDDGGGQPETREERITLSLDQVEWTTRQVTKPGRAYRLVGRSRNGQVSRRKSVYDKGVRLISRRGAAIVVYEFPIVDADGYGPLTFRVNGKSPNRHRALIGVWNPALGWIRDLRNYDATRIIGPRFRWWNTRTGDEDRVRKQRARAFVAVAKGLGKRGRSVFDIKRVRLVYRSARIIPGSGAASDPSVVATQLTGGDGTFGRSVPERSADLARTPLRILDVPIDGQDDATAAGDDAGPDTADATDPSVEAEPEAPLASPDPGTSAEPAPDADPTPSASPAPDPAEQPVATDPPEPTSTPDAGSTADPTAKPTARPTMAPTAQPAPEANEPLEPTPAPTKEPTPDPDPLAALSQDPTPSPTPEPSLQSTPNQPPTADAGGPYQVDEGESVKLDGSASSDADGKIVAYEWTRKQRLDDPAKRRPVFSAVDDGKLEIGLTVTDDDSATDTATATIRVVNVDPRLSEFGPFDVTVGEEVVLEARIRDPGIKDTLEVVVDWGDGAVGAAIVGDDGRVAVAKHAYPAPGRFEIVATVTDDDGGSGSRSADVSVAAAADDEGRAPEGEPVPASAADES